MNRRERAVTIVLWRALLGAGLSLWLATASTAAQSPAETVVVRSADHPTYSRVVFDFTDDVPYAPVLRNGELQITFDQSFTPSFGTLADQPLALISAPRVDQVDGRTRVSFTVARQAGLRHFLSGQHLVVDMIAPDTPVDTGSRTTPVSNGGNGTLGETSAPAVQPTPDSAPQPANGTQTTGLPDQTADRIRLSLQDNGLTLDYSLDGPSGAAVFLRGGHLWVVFEGRHALSHNRAALSDLTVRERLTSMEAVPDPDVTAFRYRIRANQGVAAEPTLDGWRVRLSDRPQPPTNPLTISRTGDDPAKPEVFIPVGEVGLRVRLTDPAVGDVIDVVPVQPAGTGMAEERSFAQFTILQSAQGVAVVPLSDGVTVARFLNGISVSSDKGLMLSGANERVDVDGMSMTAERLIDKPRWARFEEGNYNEVRRRLMVAVSLSPSDKRNPARWDLARFMLARGHASDALAVMHLMAEEDPELLKNPGFLAVRGVAKLDLRRFDAAVADLAHRDLDAEPDAYLWRTVAANAVGDHANALEAFRVGREALDGYGLEDRARFQLAAIRSAIATGQLQLAGEQFEKIVPYGLPEDMAAEAELIRGKLAMAQDDPATAAAQFDDVAKANYRRAAAQAKLERTKLGLTQEDFDRREAIDSLERLRFAWRGDDFEIELLNVLGQLYVADGQYRQGLEIMRQAVAYFPDNDATRPVAARMSDVFRFLYLEGGADEMGAVEAVALYEDFQELTPLGADGDRMVRRLAGRLVAVDLLDRAASLLDHQVNFRLEGAAQAQIAARLAKIYLLDRNPDAAMGVLRATRQERLPDDILRERQFVEARALTELGRFEEAEVLLEPYSGQEAEALRGDIFWGARDWQKVIANAQRRLPAEAGEGLSAAERQTLVRLAIAMSFENERESLAGLRRRYGNSMGAGEFAALFDRLTRDDVRDGGSLSDLARSIASVDQFQSFLSAYRNEFSSEAGSGR